MAIIRCPYCHAIIDENDKYCNNCGTQLLFTEDEAVEEEIPGEKIIDADVEEKDYTVDEPGDEKRPAAAKDLDTEIDEDLERELREETEEMALDELVAEGTGGEAGDEVTEEVILVDEIAASEAKAGDGSRELAEEDTAEPKKAGEEAEEAEEEDDEEEEEEKEEEEDKDEDEDEKEDSDEDEEIEEEDIAKEPAAKAGDTNDRDPRAAGSFRGSRRRRIHRRDPGDGHRLDRGRIRPAAAHLRYPGAREHRRDRRTGQRKDRQLRGGRGRGRGRAEARTAGPRAGGGKGADRGAPDRDPAPLGQHHERRARLPGGHRARRNEEDPGRRARDP